MELLDAANLSAMGVYIAFASLAVGVLTWWLSKLLSDKRDSTIHEVKIQNLERRMDDAEEDIKLLQRK